MKNKQNTTKVIVSGYNKSTSISMGTDPKIFIEDLEETTLRIHTWFRSLEEGHDQFKDVRKFLGELGLKKHTEERKKEINTYLEYLYYRGKFYAYIFVLEELGSDVPHILKRLRGMNSPQHNVMMETKAHYSEIKGHFDTYEYLDFKEQLKNGKKN